MLSLITPPDCLATYTAAAIARADFWKTGWAGMRLGIVAYVIPFAFAFQPALLGKAPAADVVVAVGAAAGVHPAGAGLRRLSRSGRSVGRRAGLRPDRPPRPRLAGGPTRALGAAALAAGLVLVLWEWVAPRRSRGAYVQPGPERPATREIR